MLELFACIITGILVSLFSVWLYFKGVEAGKALSEKRVPLPPIDFGKKIEHKKEEKTTDNFKDFIGYNG
jgi:hypothetical protein